MAQFYKVFLAAALVGLVACLQSLPAQALSANFTDGSVSSTPDVNIYPMVSRAGGSPPVVTLNAINAYFRVFIPEGHTNNVTINIINACSTDDHLREPSDYRIEAEVLQAQLNDDTDGVANNPAVSGGSTKNTTSNCSGNNLNFTVSGSQFGFDPNRYGYDYKTAVVRVSKVGSGYGIKSFKVRTSVGEVTADDLGTNRAKQDGKPGFGALSIWDSRDMASSNPEANFSFKFKPDCKYNNEPIHLKWEDADQGEDNQPGSINWVLKDITTGTITARSSTDIAPPGNIGGSDDGSGTNSFRQSNGVVLNQTHQYEWLWDNVNRKNGLQLWLPFSEKSVGIQCDPPSGAWNLEPYSAINRQAGNYASTGDYTNDVNNAFAAFDQGRFTEGVVNTTKNNVPATEHRWDVEYYYVRGDTGDPSPVHTKDTNYNGSLLGSGTREFTRSSQVPNGSASGIRWLVGDRYFDGGGAPYRVPRPNDQYCERLVRDLTPAAPNSAGAASTYTCITLNGPPICEAWHVDPSRSAIFQVDGGNSRTSGNLGRTVPAAWVNDRYEFYYDFQKTGFADETQTIYFYHNFNPVGAFPYPGWTHSQKLGVYQDQFYTGDIRDTHGGTTIRDFMAFSPTDSAPPNNCGITGGDNVIMDIVVPYFFHIMTDISAGGNIQQGGDITPVMSYSMPQVDSATGRYHTRTDDTNYTLAEVINPSSTDPATLDGLAGDNDTGGPCNYVAARGISSGSCTETYSHNPGRFTYGSFTDDGYTKPGSDTVNLPVGTKVCYIMGLTRPVEDDDDPSTTSPIWRYSKMACNTIVKKPKVQFQNSDVTVGRSFAGDGGGATEAGCTAPAVSTIETVGAPSYVDSNPASFGGVPWMYGSWVEYGAFATDKIDNFGTANIPYGLSGALSIPTRLAFGNSGTPGSFNFGKASCMSNVFALDKDSKPAPATMDYKNLPLSPDGKDVYARDGNITLQDNPGTVGLQGRDIIIHARKTSGGCSPDATASAAGDVVIRQNIDYKATGAVFSDVKQLPRVIILADCNIIVDENVELVDAWLAAKGSVMTCSYTPSPLKLDTTHCNKQVKFNGPIATKKLRLLRTGGADLTDPATRDKAAEVFDYRPDQLVVDYLQSLKKNNVRSVYQTDLPPRY